MTASKSDIWAVIPAAGSGRRMGLPTPKQYLAIQGKSVLQWTIDVLLSIPEIKHLVVAVDDLAGFQAAVRSEPRLLTVAGGCSRAQSVQNALHHVLNNADNPWVLVHDAARPCVRASNINKLITQVTRTGVGGLLAVPATDTVKEVGERQVVRTLDRDQLWLAHTPQMFRARELYNAQAEALANGAQITDEASALEWKGYRPQVVEDDRDNIKITRVDDLVLAEWYLERRGK